MDKDSWVAMMVASNKTMKKNTQSSMIVSQDVMCKHNFINYNYLIIYIQPCRSSIESNIFANERITYDSIFSHNQNETKYILPSYQFKS